VISTRSKSGTTWMQMICALLIFRDPGLPEPLPELSPWLDWLVSPKEEVYAALASQTHRRFIKTHTPLDGVPNDDRVTYIVVARHPLDAAVSLYHQGDNLDMERMRSLIGSTAEQGSARERPDEATWLRSWITSEAPAEDDLDSPAGVFWHLGDAWQRRHEDNVVLVHYEDMLADLETQMRRLADRLAIEIADSELEQLATAATFDAMRSRSDRLVPDPVGVFKDRAKFFRGGGTGSGRSLLDAEALAAYEHRAAQLAPPDLLAWLHRSGPASPS